MSERFRRLSWVGRLSERHVRSRRESDRNTATRLSVVGIAVGVMALVTVLSVMNGFQLETIEAMIEVNSYHVRIDGAAASTLDAGELESIRELPGVRAAVPFSETETILRGFFESTRGAVVRALPEDAFDRDEGLERRIEVVDGRVDLAESGAIMLGSELRRRLGVRVGDSVSLLTLAPAAREGASRVPREASLEVIGSFRTGFFEYDSGWAFISRHTAESIIGVDESDRHIGIKLDDRFADRRGAALIARELDLYGDALSTWRDYNRAIFGALRTEKVTMTLLLGLIFIVVAGNIYQSLRRSVHDRAEEIAILKAMGARPVDIQMVFVIEGVGTGLIGGVAGLTLGLAASANVNRLFAFAERAVNVALGAAETVLGPIIGGAQLQMFSPQIFYITEVPVSVVFTEVVGILFFAVTCSVLAAWLASLRAARVKPAEVLRNE